jgi:hypothetical protein
MARFKSHLKSFEKRNGGLVEATCFNGAHLLDAIRRYHGNKINILREIQAAVMNKGRRLTKKVVEWIEGIASKHKVAADFLLYYKQQELLTA